MREKFRPLLIPLVVSAAALIATFLGLVTRLDWKLYDAMLHARPSPAEDASILLTDIDDAAISTIGTWPVGRDVVADGLVALADLGARAIAFDIEYVDPSPRGVDARYLREDIPQSFSENFGTLSENIRSLFIALSRKQIPLSAAEDFVNDLTGFSDSVREELLTRVQKVASDNDDRLGKAARFMGSAYFTVNIHGDDLSIPAIGVSEEVTGKIGRPFPRAGNGILQKKAELQPTIPSILSRAAGAGFPNVFVDPDGVRRRIDLFYEYDGRLYAQLVMAPLLDIVGAPEVVVSKGSFTLADAKLPSGEILDLRIPRAQDGRVLIDWPHKEYIDSFRHVTFGKYINHELLFSELAHNLRIRDTWGYFHAYEGQESLAALAARIQEFRRACLTEDDAPPEDSSAVLRALRDGLLAECRGFLATKPEEAILAEIDGLLASAKLDAATREQYQLIKEDAPSYFAKTRGLVDELSELRSKLREATQEAFCIIGYTATGTTDIGVNPFAGEYVNVGTHAAVYNTMLHRAFIDDVPAWIPLLLGMAASFGLAFLIQGRSPALAISIGMGLTTALGVLVVAVFVFGSLFVPPSIPILASFLTFLSSTIVNFIRTEREKGFLRNAFSHYLSAEVIKEIVSDPSKLQLGGTKKTMTAMFTDIRGFSTVSEKLTPEDLVRLLNRYLTGMSDVILDLKGTIDKYEGDAIIAFFGAPIDLPDHVERACRAAVRMKRIEAELNKQFLSDGVSPSPLLTRVGLNTGDMVVGNMGTTRKMDYTIIGDAVNLAARLEGVNKQYGTWVCASEDTVNAAGNSFLFRRLDKIRVVGKSQPIRIFELVEERHELSEERRAFYARFEEAMGIFESRDWRGARAAFVGCLASSPEDGPSKTYLQRSENYIQKPPAADWDGVYNLTQK